MIEHYDRIEILAVCEYDTTHGRGEPLIRLSYIVRESSQPLRVGFAETTKIDKAALPGLGITVGQIYGARFVSATRQAYGRYERSEKMLLDSIWEASEDCYRR